MSDFGHGLMPNLATDTRAALAALAARMHDNLDELKRPLVIEFAGTPKAGKSTSVSALAKFFRRQDIDVQVVTERASVCPIRDKTSALFNVWTGTTSLTHLLEAMEKKTHVIILDRGIFDALVWMHFHESRNPTDRHEYDGIRRFLLLDWWVDKMDIVVALTTTPEESLTREYKDQIIERAGSIMNEEVLKQYNDSLRHCIKLYDKIFKVVTIDTTNRVPIDGVTRIAWEVLQAADRKIDEEIATVDVHFVRSRLPPDGVLTDPEQIVDLISDLQRKIVWMRRTDAENSPHLVQPIPAALIYRGHDELLLANIRGVKHKSLAERRTVWLGGHVRRSDLPRHGQGRTLFRRTLARELAEELRLSSVPKFDSLPQHPVAIVWDSTRTRSVQHIGLLYRCRLGHELQRDLQLHEREFEEVPGKSVFTRFARVASELAKLPDLERWSAMFLSRVYGLELTAHAEDQKVMF